MRQSLTRFLLLGCMIAAFGPVSARAGFTPLYSNTTTFSGLGYVGGGATNVNGDLTTAMVFDDITAGAGLGGFSVQPAQFLRHQLQFQLGPRGGDRADLCRTVRTATPAL